MLFSLESCQWPHLSDEGVCAEYSAGRDSIESAVDQRHSSYVHEAHEVSNHCVEKSPYGNYEEAASCLLSKQSPRYSC